MGLDRAPIEFQTFYFSHVWLVPPNTHDDDHDGHSDHGDHRDDHGDVCG